MNKVSSTEEAQYSQIAIVAFLEFKIFPFQCLPDEVAELRDHRRELERQRQNQNLMRSEAIQSEEELLKQDTIDHTEV